jgi:hypothetical protein
MSDRLAETVDCTEVRLPEERLLPPWIRTQLHQLAVGLLPHVEFDYRKAWMLAATQWFAVEAELARGLELIPGEAYMYMAGEKDDGGLIIRTKRR